MATRNYEDLTVGDVWDDFDTVTVEAEEIIAFAERYDPLAMHTDPEQAAETHFGGLIASGWQTLCLTWSVIAPEFISTLPVIAGVGVDDMRWYRPVRPGDTLSFQIEIADKQPTNDRADRALLTNEVSVFNQDDETVMSMLSITLIHRPHRQDSESTD